MNENRVFHFGPKAIAFHDQLIADTKLLSEIKVMDYSLLVSVNTIWLMLMRK
jgi:hypothetical protein